MEKEIWRAIPRKNKIAVFLLWGAVIALCPNRADEVLKRWRSLGCYGFLTQVGA